MVDQSQDRSLHFIVRHPGYRQNLGYGAYLNDVLQDLNQLHPNNAMDLIRGSADLMAGRNKRPDGAPKPDVSAGQSPQKQLRIDRIKAQLSLGDSKTIELFGSVASDQFGVILERKGRSLSSAMRGRGYYDAVKRNIGDVVRHNDADQHTFSFNYKLKDGRVLDLMHIVLAPELQRKYQQEVELENKSE